MANDNVISVKDRVIEQSRSALDELLHEGARQMLQHAIENEVAEYTEGHQQLIDESGRRLVVHNGHLPERDLVTGVGPVRVKQPRQNGALQSTPFLVSSLSADESRPSAASGERPACDLHQIRIGQT